RRHSLVLKLCETSIDCGASIRHAANSVSGCCPAACRKDSKPPCVPPVSAAHRTPDYPLLAIVGEEALQTLHRLGEHVCARQEHDAEVVHVADVEATAFHQQYLFLQQEVEDQLVIADDVVAPRIKAREQVDGSARLHAGDAFHLGEHFPGYVALVAQAA